MTVRTLDHLKELALEHEYIDVEHDKTAAKWVRDQNHGREKKPTLDINGTILTEPSDDDLDETLRELHLLK